MTITLTSAASIRGRLSAARDGGTAYFDVDHRDAKTIADGELLDQANAVYIDDFSIAASGTLVIDLAGTLTDALGNTVVFTAVKEIMITADPGNTNNIVAGNGGANSFVGPFGAAAHTAAVTPGNRFNATNYSAAGWPVVAGTGDLLQLSNSGAGSVVTGTITVVGLA